LAKKRIAAAAACRRHCFSSFGLRLRYSLLLMGQLLLLATGRSYRILNPMGAY
jgi:hypothetical protein